MRWRALSQMVLGPAARSLTAKRLLIVADGALHYVPFAALPHPAGRGEPLLVRHEVAAAPSASVVAMLRRETGRRRPRRPDPRRAGGSGVRPPTSGWARRGRPWPRAAPSPGRDDAICAPCAARPGGRHPAATALHAAGSGGDPLAGAAAGAQGGAGFRRQPGHGVGPGLADFRLLHFATHGFLNSAKPELSGIVLSLVDQGGADARGFLSTTDVFDLHLNADMVVLSGCRTALGTGAAWRRAGGPEPRLHVRRRAPRGRQPVEGG